MVTTRPPWLCFSLLVWWWQRLSSWQPADDALSTHSTYVWTVSEKKKYLFTSSHSRPPALSQEASFSLRATPTLPSSCSAWQSVVVKHSRSSAFLTTALSYKHLSKKNTTLLPVSVAFIYYWLADKQKAGKNCARQCRDKRRKSGFFLFLSYFFFKCRKIFSSDFFNLFFFFTFLPSPLSPGGQSQLWAFSLSLSLSRFDSLQRRHGGKLSKTKEKRDMKLSSQGHHLKKLKKK